MIEIERHVDGQERSFGVGIHSCILGALTAFLLTLTSAGCGAPLPAQHEAVRTEALAEVNGRLVLQTDFEDFVELKGDDAETLSELELIKSFLTQQVLLQAALEKGVTVPEEELNRTAQEWFPLNAEPEAKDLDLVRDYLIIQNFIRQECAPETEVGLREMRQYYVQHADEFRVDDQLRILEILVKDRDTAERMREELEPGNFRLFRQKAMESSIGNAAASGGELGLFSPGDLPGRFEKVIFGLKLGEISPVFWSEHGFHLFMVEERIPRHDQKFHEVHEEIFRRLVSAKERQALAELVPRLLGKAKIHIFEDGNKREWSF